VKFFTNELSIADYSVNEAYQAYLNSPEWRAKRQDVLALAGYRCVACGKTIDLEVHHITYERIYRELVNDLLALCQNCHKEAHGLSRE